MAWGLWRIPEARLRLLGPVRGRTALELGCGAARWSIALRRRGGRPVGLDLSEAQLRRARALQRRTGVRFPLVHASAERLPFSDASFDLAFCDWGALTFADPERVVPEAGRVLRPGGVLAFAAAHPFRYLAFDRRHDRQARRLYRPYFDAGRFTFAPWETTEFRPTFEEWLRLFARSGLAVDRLLETRPAVGARSSYLGARDTAWGRKWPLECLWRLVKLA